MTFSLKGIQLSIKDLGMVQNTTWEARAQWYSVGLGLGISANTLDAIKKNNHDICEDSYIAVLKNWLSRKHHKPTWNALAEALRCPSVGLGHLAEQLPPQGKLIITNWSGKNVNQVLIVCS